MAIRGNFKIISSDSIKKISWNFWEKMAKWTRSGNAGSSIMRRNIPKGKQNLPWMKWMTSNDLRKKKSMKIGCRSRPSRSAFCVFHAPEQNDGERMGGGGEKCNQWKMDNIPRPFLSPDGQTWTSWSITSNKKNIFLWGNYSGWTTKMKTLIWMNEGCSRRLTNRYHVPKRSAE